MLVLQLQCVRCLLLLLIFELSLIGSAEAPSPLSPLCLARVHLLFTHLPVHAPPTPTPRPFTARRSHRRRHASTSCPLCVLPSDNRRCQSVNHFRSPLRRCTFPFWLSFSLGTDNSWRKLSFTCLLCQPLSSLSSVSHSLSLTFPLSSHRFLIYFRTFSLFAIFRVTCTGELLRWAIFLHDDYRPSAAATRHHHQQYCAAQFTFYFYCHAASYWPALRHTDAGLYREITVLSIELQQWLSSPSASVCSIVVRWLARMLLEVITR